MPCDNHPDVLTGLSQCVRCHRRMCSDCIIRLRGRPVCVRCKMFVLRAMRSGGQRGPRLASRGARWGARFLDTLIITVPIFGILVLLARQGVLLEGPEFMFCYFCCWVLAFGIYDAGMLCWRGQTLGKMALGMRVVAADGTAINAGQAWGRTIARMMFSLASLNLFDVLFIFSRRCTCLHDRMAGTIVITGGARSSRGRSARLRSRRIRSATRSYQR